MVFTTQFIALRDRSFSLQRTEGDRFVFYWRYLLDTLASDASTKTSAWLYDRKPDCVEIYQKTWLFLILMGMHLIFSYKFRVSSYLSVPIIPDFITIAVQEFYEETDNRKRKVQQTNTNT